MPVAFLGFFLFFDRIGLGGTFRPRHYQTAHTTPAWDCNQYFTLLCLCVCVYRRMHWGQNVLVIYSQRLCVLISSQRPFLGFVHWGAPNTPTHTLRNLNGWGFFISQWGEQAPAYISNLGLFPKGVCVCVWGERKYFVSPLPLFFYVHLSVFPS